MTYQSYDICILEFGFKTYAYLVSYMPLTITYLYPTKKSKYEGKNNFSYFLFFPSYLGLSFSSGLNQRSFDFFRGVQYVFCFPGGLNVEVTDESTNSPPKTTRWVRKETFLQNIYPWVRVTRCIRWLLCELHWPKTKYLTTFVFDKPKWRKSYKI